MATEIVLAAETGLQLQAVSGDQMISAHEQMRTWVAAQIARLDSELKEEDEALNIAERNKWSVTRHRRKCRELERRIQFFQKIDEALEAGFVIVPNFGMDIFVIRTDRKAPTRNVVDGGSWNVRAQSARVLPMGEGEYRNPVPFKQPTRALAFRYLSLFFLKASTMEPPR